MNKTGAKVVTQINFINRKDRNTKLIVSIVMKVINKNKNFSHSDYK
jgi:hypothetical protein